MSTVTTHDIAIQRTGREAIRSEALPAADVSRKRSAVSRLFTWYREAVLSPTTEKEEEDWQKHSF